jgi:hypothetical protein
MHDAYGLNDLDAAAQLSKKWAEFFSLPLLGSAGMQAGRSPVPAIWACNAARQNRNLRAVICKAKLKHGTSQGHETNMLKAASDIGRNLRKHIPGCFAIAIYKGLASRSNSVVFPRDLGLHISTGVRRHTSGARCKSVITNTTSKFGQGPKGSTIP